MDEGSHLFGIGRRLVWDRVKRGEHGGGMVGSEHCCRPHMADKSLQ